MQQAFPSLFTVAPACETSAAPQAGILNEALCLQPGLHVSELGKLSALTGLRVWFDTDGPDSFDECMRGLAAVTRLQELRLAESLGYRVDALLPLTSLTALTKFKSEKGIDSLDDAVFLDSPDDAVFFDCKTATEVSSLGTSRCISCIIMLI
jgi:hypothetical protein